VKGRKKSLAAHTDAFMVAFSITIQEIEATSPVRSILAGSAKQQGNHSTLQRILDSRRKNLASSTAQEENVHLVLMQISPGNWPNFFSKFRTHDGIARQHRT
jgi:hypothetical protein